MSETIYSTDDAWIDTLPHILKPNLQQKEWLLGVLLRCDKENDWVAGSTLQLVFSASPTISRRNPVGFFVAAGQLDFSRLAQLINVPVEDVQKTTYRVNLARLYSTTAPQSRMLGPIRLLRVCPACLDEDLLTKYLCLPLLRSCPIHKYMFQDRCECGASLQPFDLKSPAFTCGACGLPWQSLPRVQASADVVASNTILLDYYERFLERGTSSSIKDALHNVRRELVEYGAPALPDETIFGVSLPRYFSPTISLTFLIASMAFFEMPTNGSMPSATQEDRGLACLNPACAMVGLTGRSNINGAGYRENRRQYYCIECGSRFNGDKIYMSFDDICGTLPNGPRLASVRRAQERVSIWARQLEVVCGEMLVAMEPINTEVAFHRVGIPRKGWYRARRLGLVGIIQKYAGRQKERLATDADEHWAMRRHMYRRNTRQDTNSSDTPTTSNVFDLRKPRLRRMGRQHDEPKMAIMRDGYTSDLTDAEWEAMRDKVVPMRRQTVDRREVVNAILYVLAKKCAWTRLPLGFPRCTTVNYYYWVWRRNGMWEYIEATLREMR